jgi:hypothetical protein
LLFVIYKKIDIYLFNFVRKTRNISDAVRVNVENLKNKEKDFSEYKDNKKIII